jgi:NhaP-type Na+/H+ and K+/H+ antiporter
MFIWENMFTSILLHFVQNIHKVYENHILSTDMLCFCRAEDEDSTKANEYFSRQRNVIQKKGFRIKSIISSHVDILTVTDADTGMRKFLLPDPICDMFEPQRRA